jgi:lysozyme
MPRSRTVRHTLAGLALITTLGATAWQPAGAHPVAATGRAPDARGVDVSSYQHPGGQPIDWARVRAAGISFAFIKADEGPRGSGRYVNPYFRADWDGARRAGVLVGAYHYARPRRPVAATADADARAFVSGVGPSLARAGLPPVLDLEEAGGLGPAEVRAWASQWLATVEALTGRTPVVYTARWFWDGFAGAAPVLGRYPLWVARYADAPGTLPAGWATWSFWQHAATGRVPGIPTPVDLNLSCGSATDLTGECRLGRPVG